MSSILQQELQSFPHVVDVHLSGSSAVTFGVRTVDGILHVLLWTRTAHKIMELLVATSNTDLLYTRDDLYDFVQSSIPVHDLLRSTNNKEQATAPWLSLSVHTMFHNARQLPTDLNHSHYCALQVKNALVDAARAWSSGGDRPTVDTVDPDVPVTLLLRGQKDGGATAALYRTVHGGGSLHKRGYRQDTAIHKASLKESTAAALLLAAGWSPEKSATHILVDPMMGSGTFLAEGVLIAADYAPGLMRIRCHSGGDGDLTAASLQLPPVVRWDPDTLQASWRTALREATVRAKAGLQRLATASPPRFAGNDCHPGATRLARESWRAAGIEQVIAPADSSEDCACWVGPLSDDDPWMIVSNPPWGVRLAEDIDTDTAWEALRVFVRDTCPQTKGSVAWVLSGDMAATRILRLRKSRSISLQTGEQDLRWLMYELGGCPPDGRGRNVVAPRRPVVVIDDADNEWL